MAAHAMRNLLNILINTKLGVACLMVCLRGGGCCMTERVITVGY